MACSCDLEELFGCIQEGPVDRIEDLAKAAQDCIAEKHNETMRVKEKLYLVAHAKSWSPIEKALDCYLSFDDQIHAITFYDEYTYLDKLQAFRPKEYMEHVMMHVRLDSMDSIKLFLDPIKDSLTESQKNDLLKEAHPVFCKPKLLEYLNQ